MPHLPWQYNEWRGNRSVGLSGFFPKRFGKCSPTVSRRWCQSPQVQVAAACDRGVVGIGLGLATVGASRAVAGAPEDEPFTMTVLDIGVVYRN